jgi:Flp pilus assembly protein TadD
VRRLPPLILLAFLLIPRSGVADACWDAARPLAAQGQWAAVEKTLRGFPARTRPCQLLLAEALIHQEKHTFALEILRALIEADPGDAAARAILGAALMGMGDHESLLAVAQELPATPSGDPWTGVLEHQRAAAEFRAGDARQARVRLHRLLGSPAGHIYRDEADRFLDLTWLYSYGARTNPRIDLATGIQYDSNAAFDPSDPDLSVIEDAPAAWRGWLSAAARVPILWGYRTVLQANAGAYRSFHSTALANDFNYTDFSGGLALSHRMVWGDRDAVLEVAWQSRIGFLDGGPLLPEPGFFAFIESHSGAAGFRVEAADGLLLGLTAVGGYQRYAELARNNYGAGGLLSLLWTASPVTLAFTGSGMYREADSEGYDRVEAATRLSLDVQLPWEVRIGASGGFGLNDYLNSADWFEEGPARRDTRWDTKLTLARPIAWGLGVELHGGYASRQSNVGTFAYDQWTAGINFTWEQVWPR